MVNETTFSVRKVREQRRSRLISLHARAAIVVLGVSAAALAGPTLAASPTASNAPPAFARCAACHSVARGTASGIGPNLFAIVGAKAAMKPDYAYSAALKKSGLIWTEASLTKFLANPAGTVPGTKMMNPGLTKPADRDAILAYLATLK